MLLLVYGVALLTATLVSEWSNRTVLSSAVLFLAFGAAAGPLGLDLIDISLDSPLVQQVSELALFAILFSDGLKVGWPDLRRAWRLPGRALLIGMPLTAGTIAVIGHLLLGLPWLGALLVGVVLSPTDPVFAAAIVGRREIPGRVRHLLNIESGVNDGLALPFVILLIEVLSHEPQAPVVLLTEVAGGIAVGIVVAGTAALVRRLRLFSVAPSHDALLPFAIAIVILAAADVLHWNPYLAGFAGGVTLATLDSHIPDAFADMGARLSEILKLAAVLVVAIALGVVVDGMRTLDVVFAVLALTVGRIGPILLALAGSGLSWRERLVAGWFGPKGFASIIYGLMVLHSLADDADQLFRLVAVTVVLSIVLHSSTDIPVAHLFSRERERFEPAHRPQPNV